MVKFLEGFLRNLSITQSRQLMRTLSKMKDTGEIRSPADFEKKLVELANLLQNDSLSQRTPPLFFSSGELLESNAIRIFYEKVQLDLESALSETERLGNTMRSHSKILNDNYFNAIELAITELESEVRAYEILETQKFTGFSTQVQRLTFSGVSSVAGSNEGDPFTSILFEDQRGHQDLVFSPPRRGEKGIHLGVDSGNDEYEHYFDKIEVETDSNTPQTIYSTATADNVPNNVIDGDEDTMWRFSVLLRDHPDTCQLKLGLSFRTARRVNAIAINPIADLNLKIASVSYVDSGNNENSLRIGSESIDTSISTLFTRSGPLGTITETSSDYILPNTLSVIPVGDIIAKKITITFQQDSAIGANYFAYDTDLGSWQRATPIEDFAYNLLSHRRDMYDSISPDELEDERRIPIQLHEYVFGFKDIYAIEREYKKNGLFVPVPFTTNYAPSVLAFYTDIEYPSDESTDVEMLLKKEDYNSEGSLIRSKLIPVIAYGDNSLNERIFLTERNSSSGINDTAKLRFYPDFSETFKVYKNQEELTIGTDYEISVDNRVSWESSIPPTGTTEIPPICLIRFKSPSYNDVLSTQYSPLLSTSSEGGELWLDEEQYTRLGRFQVIVFDNKKNPQPVTSCKMALQIILRSNTLNTRISPFLKEVVILGDKFNG